MLSQNLFCHLNKARNSYCQRLKINTVSHRLRAEKVVKLLSRPKRQEQDIIVPWENLAMNVTQKPHYSLAVCQCSHKKFTKKLRQKRMEIPVELASHRSLPFSFSFYVEKSKVEILKG